MLIKTNPVSRRRILQGILNGGAVAVSLPFLEMFLNENGDALAATGQPLPLRFGTWFWGLGCDPAPFTPKTTGANYELPPQLAPLAKVKDYLNVYTNYNVLTDGRPNLCHYTGWVGLRVGTAPQSRGTLPGGSLDVDIADVIGGGTRFKTLNLAAVGGNRNSMSFRSSDAVNPSEGSAVGLYKAIFGPEFQDPNAPTFTPNPQLMVRRSVLSGVSEQRKDLEMGLGTADKQLLDQYFTSIRELEGRIDLQLQKPPAAPDCKAPAPVTSEASIGTEVEIVQSRHRAMVDLLAMALTCNQTKVFNMVYSGSASQLTKRGNAKTHHVTTHEEPIDPKTGFQPTASYFIAEAMKEWGYMVDKLASTKEGGVSLLDRCVVYAHSDCQVAKVHSLPGIPMMTAGNLGGKIKTGMHIDGKGQAGSLLGFTLQRLMGVSLTAWGTGSMRVSQEISDIMA